MTVAELNAAIVFCEEKFGIVLTSWGSFSTRPKFSARELWALCAGAEEGTSHRDRVLAVRRLSKLGFRVSFTEDGPRPGALK